MNFIPEIILEPYFWKRAAQIGPRATVLPKMISDTHHLIGQTVTVRNSQITHTIETSGIDYIGCHPAAALSPIEILNYLEKASLSEARGTPSVNANGDYTQPHQSKSQCGNEVCGLL